jgi:hypothetical protein
MHLTFLIKCGGGVVFHEIFNIPCRSFISELCALNIPVE